MLKQGRQRNFGTTVTIVLVAAIIWAGCKKHPDKAQNERHPEAPLPKAVVENIAESAKTDTNIPASSKVLLYDVIKAARTWQPVYTSSYHKHAPDFTLTDITDKEHKLSDYRGRDVLLVFWATWCPPCRVEVPALIELRRTTSENKLAILAISNEKADVVGKFVADQMINYTVLLDKGNMPSPFGFMRIYSTTGVPCSFFIDPDGKIKLATAGLLPLRDIKAILQAE